MANNGRITRGQETAIAALLSSPSVPEAAKLAGLADRTLYRWLGREDFQASYRTARREVVRHAVTKIQACMADAINTLRGVMIDKDAPASARVSAARAMLDLGLKATELEDLERRIAELERQIAERK